MQNELLKAVCKGESVQQIKDILVVDPNSVYQCLGRSTPLMSAAKYGRHDIVDLLLSAGSPVGDVDKAGKTALCIAANHGHLNVVSSLISAGADVNHRGKDGTTPLMICSQSGRTKLIELLLTNGADRETIRKSDSKKAIDLSSSALVKSLLESSCSFKYRTMYSEEDCQLLENQRFEFPARKERCIRYVTVEQLPAGTGTTLPGCENLLYEHSSSLHANKDISLPTRCPVHGNAFDFSECSSSNSNSSSSAKQFHGKDFQQTHLVLKCCTNLDMMSRECNLLKHLHTRYGKDTPFIALADCSHTVLTFRQVRDGDVHRVFDDIDGGSYCPLYDSKPQYSIGEVATVDNSTVDNSNSTSDLAVRTNTSEYPQCERTWHGLLLERGVCDLNAFGSDVLSERNVRRSVNNTEQLKKIPRAEGSDGSVCSRKKDGHSKGQGQGQGSHEGESCFTHSDDSHYGEHTSHQSKGRISTNGGEPCPRPSNDMNRDRNRDRNRSRSTDTYRDDFLSDTKKLKVAISVSIQVCRILSVLHESGVVWLDVKPSNFVLFSGQVISDSKLIEKSKLSDALMDLREEKSEEPNSKRGYLNGNKTKIFKTNDYFKLFEDKCDTQGDVLSIVVKAIDLGGCVPINSMHAPSALTFSSKYSPPELARKLTMHRGEKERDPGSDSGLEIFQVLPSADCWSLGVTLMQIFHRDFRCYFAETDSDAAIGDDRNICATHCPDGTHRNSSRNTQIDGISTQDSHSTFLKGSDAALVRLSVPPSALDGDLEEYLGPITTHTAGTTHTNTTHTAHTTCTMKTAVDEGDMSDSDSSVKPPIFSSCECLNVERVRVLTDVDTQEQECSSATVGAEERAEVRAEEMSRSDKRGIETETEVEHDQRDRVIGIIRQLLRVTPCERISALTALHLLQREQEKP